MDKENYLIRVENLHKYFKDLHVLKGMNVNVKKSEVIAIIGASGSGKSTFLRCINRLEEPSRGKIFIEDVEITDSKIDLNSVRTEIGMVFQSFNLFPHMKVIDNVTIAPIENLHVPKQEAEDTARRLLDKVGVIEKINYYPDQLSGGQQQRVAIARALAMNPSIMLFDEPTSALDPEMIGEVLDVMKNLAKEGMTMLVVSHEMGFIKQAADRVLVLADGEIVEDESPEVLFNNPSHEKTRKFLRKIL